jgi:F0F1-type ATP synthase membrane subunit b/b'
MVVLAFAESVQLFPDGTLFIHIALILLMIWVLNRTFFRPINRVIESREKHKGGRGGEAQAILGEVGEKQAKYNQELLAARSQGYELIEKERAGAVDERKNAITAAKSETASALASEKQEVNEQAAAARSVIAKEAEGMADTITSNILKA